MPDAEMELRHIATFETVRRTLLEQRAVWEERTESNPNALSIIEGIDDHLQLNADLLQIAQDTLARGRKSGN